MQFIIFIILTLTGLLIVPSAPVRAQANLLEAYRNPRADQDLLSPVNREDPVTLRDLLPFSTLKESSELSELIADGRYDAALSLLDRIYGKRPLVNNDALRLLEGILAYRSGQYGRAVTVLEGTDSLHSYLYPYLRLWLGRAHLAEGQMKKALDVLNVSRDPLPRLISRDLFWERMKALVALKYWNEATVALDEWKKDASPSDEAAIAFYRGLMALSQGRTAEAKGIFKKIYLERPGTEFDDPILYLLRAPGEKNPQLAREEWIKRAASFVEVGLPLEAVKIYEHLVTPQEPLTRAMADAYFSGRFYKPAAEYYQKLWNKASLQERGRLVEKLATSYVRSNQFKEAIHYTKERKKHGSGKRIDADIQQRLAYIYFDSGDYQKAFKEYTHLAIQPAPPSQHVKYLWFKAWSAYLLKDYNSALRDFLILASKTSKGERRTLLYWRARCLEQLGQKTGGKSIYQGLIQEKATDFYGLLSRQRLRKGHLHPQTIINDETSSVIPKAPKLEEIRLSDIYVPSSESMRRAIVLSQIGLPHYAYDESLQAAEAGEGVAPGQLLQSLILAQNFTRLYVMGQGKGKEAAVLLNTRSLAYPQAYPALVNFFSEKIGLDRYLAWSIMRQESVFKPFVVSPAQAMGLMQIIPQTGKEIADDLEINSFLPDDLKDPAINIQFGTWYLKKRMAQFHGNIVYTIASYNAGPDAVLRWTHWGKELPADEFIELIPYKETNNYVKKVLHNYWVYRRLYE